MQKKNTLLHAISLIFSLITSIIQAQAVLTTSPYSESFDGIATALPVGWTLRTGATATALGNVSAAFNKNTVAWNSTAGAFKNFASADLTASAAADTTANGLQKTTSDRALGIRQTSGFGDNGAAFVLQLANTSGKTNFVLKFKLQSLDVASPRTATWRIDYGIGANPASFTPDSQTFTTGGSSFSNTNITVNFGAALDNQADNVWIRIVTLSATTGSGNRPSTALDDLSLAFDVGNAPTPNLTLSGNLQPFVTAPGMPSAAQSYSLAGTNLTADVMVTAPPDFEIRTAFGTFGGSLTLSQTGGTLANTPVFVRFNPATVGAKTGSITHISGTTSKNLEVSGSNPGAVISIAQARNLPLGTQVTVAGRLTVSNQFGSSEITLQDSTAGMGFFISDDASQLSGLSIGDSVVVSGKTAEFQATTGQVGTGNFQVSGKAAEVSITRINTTSRLPVPKSIVLSQFSEGLEGQLVKINAATFAETGNFKPETNYTLSDASAAAAQVRTDGDTDFFGDNLSSIPSGATSVTGIITQFRGTYQLKPRSRADIPASKLVAYVSTKNDATPRSQTLDLATWNMEWFGDLAFGPTDNALQAANAAKVLAESDFDLVGVQEVVDTVLFRSMIAQLNALKPGAAYKGFTTPTARSQSQKVGFVFKSSVIDSVSSRFSLAPVTVSTSSWAYNGTVSRPPFEFEFDYKYGNSQKKRLKAIVLHGNAGNTDQPKRVLDYQQLKAYTDTQFPNIPLIILGDWNDILRGSIDGAGKDSPMKNFVDDAANYKFLTLPLSDLGLSSQTLGSLIDHILISKQLYANVLDSTTRVASVGFIPAYNSTTSDHTPVSARLLFPDCSVLALPVFTVSGNVFAASLTLTSNAATGNQWLKDGLEIAGATAQTYPVTAAGNYALRVSYPNGCVLTSASTAITATEENSPTTSFQAYPNPTTGNISLVFSTQKSPYVVELLDAQGRTLGIFSGKASVIENQLSQELALVAPGLYFVKSKGSTIKLLRE